MVLDEAFGPGAYRGASPRQPGSGGNGEDDAPVRADGEADPLCPHALAEGVRDGAGREDEGFLFDRHVMSPSSSKVMNVNFFIITRK